MPTTLALIDQPAAQELPGINVFDQAALDKRTAVFGEIFEHDIADMRDAAASLQYRWIIEGSDKLIVPAARMSQSATPQTEPELYNLRDDPQEMQNLAGRADQQEKIKRLRDRIDQWWAVN